MRSLTPDQLEFLRRFGFDELLFAAWRKGVAHGWLAKDKNVLRQPMLPPQPNAIQRLPKRGSTERAALEELGAEAIARGELGVVILNGGMATRFGGVVKGIVPALGTRSFLDLKMSDVAKAQTQHGGRIAVFLMNSFATDAATREHLAAREHFGLDPAQVRCFTQFISARLLPDGDIFVDESGEISPYGPGHGDFGPALRASGCLRAFLDGGGKYLFVANVDNLGARIDAALLGHHIQGGNDMTVEAAPKWPGDVGGSPFVVDGKLQLVEQIRYPEGFDPDIVDVFNTNTFWFTASALDQEYELGWYFVEKTVGGQPVVQIERLIGELTRFLSCDFVRVKRSGAENRFFPIKTPEDLRAGQEEIALMYGA
jgi:UTP--glucose-1-phosphate uridylyltransferase